MLFNVQARVMFFAVADGVVVVVVGVVVAVVFVVALSLSLSLHHCFISIKPQLHAPWTPRYGHGPDPRDLFAFSFDERRCIGQMLVL